MLKSASHMKDLSIHASDGQIGSIEEFYFDDDTWAVRYMVVNTGPWLFRKQVLISPVFLRSADWDNKQIILALTKKQIEDSPDIDTHKPVSRQHEVDYMDYFGSSYYWGGSYMWGPGLYPGDLAGAAIPLPARSAKPSENLADSHLCSTAAVSGYHIETNDGHIGHVADFIVDQDTWSIRYLVIDTHNVLPGKVVLISPEWIQNVSWADSKVCVGLSREMIKSTPEYIESRGISREYEKEIHDHYGMPPYWLRESKSLLVRAATENSIG